MSTAKKHLIVLPQLIFATIFFALLLATPASATNLGITAVPVGASNSACAVTAVYSQYTSAAGRSYVVPAGGGQIASWSTVTTNDVAGSSKSLVVINPGSGSFTYSVRAIDTQTIPNPLPASGLATFELAAPINVAAGDLLAIISNNNSDTCLFTGGSLNSADIVIASTFAAPLAVNSTLTPGGSGANYTLNLGADIVQNMDISVTATSIPNNIKVGGTSVVNFVVSNNGNSVKPIELHYAVPSGLDILAASANGTDCTVTGQAVDCVINDVAVGGQAVAQIVLVASAAGTYNNSATVSTRFTDPNPNNNTASTSITATAVDSGGGGTGGTGGTGGGNNATPPACKTISLKGQKLSFAKKAIVALNCKVGKVSKKTSKKVKKGFVISTNPGSGKTLVNNAAINIIVSNGKPKAHHHK